MTNSKVPLCCLPHNNDAKPNSDFLGLGLLWVWVVSIGLSFVGSLPIMMLYLVVTLVRGVTLGRRGGLPVDVTSHRDLTFPVERRDAATDPDVQD